LTNELALEPGVIPVLCLRRWDEERKNASTHVKNDFSQSKASGKHRVAIEKQAYLAIITHLLVAMLVHEKVQSGRIGDERALKKQAIRNEEVALPSCSAGLSVHLQN